MSKKKLRRMNRLTVAELKQVRGARYRGGSDGVGQAPPHRPPLPLQLVARPDVVEMHDVTAQEPKLLVHLKATRNTVPVPRHWCFKRKYLQGKRGIEKPPFQLPEFIRRTGIQEMREALQEKVGRRFCCLAAGFMDDVTVGFCFFGIRRKTQKP